MSKLKEWPPYPELIVGGDALEPLMRVIDSRDPAQYDGYDFGPSTKAMCPAPDEFLAGADEDEGGIESLRGRVLLVAFQLGVEQGRRLSPTSVRAGMRPLDYLMLAMSAGRRYLEATGWVAREWERGEDGRQRPVERSWMPPGGGEPVTYLEALHAGAFGHIGRDGPAGALVGVPLRDRLEWRAKLDPDIAAVLTLVRDMEYALVGRFYG